MLHKALCKVLLAGSLPAMLLVAPAAALAAAAGESAVEEIVVTGSFIRGTPQDAALPVDLISQEDLIDSGSPTITEMIRNLNISNGNIGETNQFNASGGQGNEGVATINLRGLGSARSLVLINGRRHVADSAIGVDISAIPSIAIGRLEVLKDGAAALYGSDAIAGVANFITRENYEGVEFRTSGQTFAESDGEYSFSMIGGRSFGRVSAMGALEYERRSEVQLRDIDYLVPSFAENVQGGFSAIGNPGTIYQTDATTPVSLVGGLVAGTAVIDPECANFGNTPAALCRFQYTQFDNLVEEQDTWKAYGEVNVELSDTVNWHTEALYAYVDMPQWATSPSYPPQALFGPDRRIPVTHPGIADFRSKYPTALTADNTTHVIVLQRHAGAGGFGSNGDPRRTFRETTTWRFATALNGTLFDGDLGFDIALSHSRRERVIGGVDMYVERMALALDGLGGPNCNPATGTAGTGDCHYYTPTSNGFARSAINGYENPNANQDLVAANQRLQPWLEAEFSTETTSELTVFDATFDGVLPIQLGGGEVGYALGVQTRHEKYDYAPDALNDITVNPCPFTSASSVTLGNTDTLDCAVSVNTQETGLFAFLAATEPQKTDRTIYGAFAELGLPITERLNAQFAIRYEDYGSGVGQTIDPKLALRFQATDAIALRGSASTTFRGPPQNFLGGRITSLQYVAVTEAFKAVDRQGNPDLKQEEAVATNFGVVVDVGNFFGSLDWWRFDFTDPIQFESHNGIASQYGALMCAPGMTTASGAEEACAALSSRLTFQTGSNEAPSDIARIATRYINGGDITTSGIDWFAQYDMETGLGQFSVGTQGTYTNEYEVDDFLTEEGVFLASGGDFAGSLNDIRDSLTPVVDLQANAFLQYARANHRARLTVRYWGEYEDDEQGVSGETPDATQELEKIDAMVTVDLNYNLSLLEDRARVNLTLFNLLDEEPPQARTDLNYDPYTHSAFGRVIKLGVIFSL